MKTKHRLPILASSFFSYLFGWNNARRTCHSTDFPGASVTIPVFMLPRSFPKGSAKLNCSSMAANCFVGGA